MHRNVTKRMKWDLAFDEGGSRYGDMTSNMAECFSSVIKGILALPMTTIVQYTFDKLNQYFQHYMEETNKKVARHNKKSASIHYRFLNG
jgi:hypothetical protein